MNQVEIRIYLKGIYGCRNIDYYTIDNKNFKNKFICGCKDGKFGFIKFIKGFKEYYDYDDEIHDDLTIIRFTIFENK